MLELGGYAGAWPAGLDPATNVNGAADQDQMNSIFGQLFQLAAGGKVVADLAASATPSAGGKTWTITLQPNLKFSDGTPLERRRPLLPTGSAIWPTRVPASRSFRR